VLASTVVGFLTVGLNYLSPDTVFLFLLNSSGAIALFVWLIIAVSQLRLRRRLEAAGAVDIPLKMWAFPYSTYATIAAIIALLVGMAFLPATREQLLVSCALATVVVAIGVFRRR
jgi:GABA permease